MASFKKQDSGKWSVRFWVKVNGQQVQKRLSGFDTKREADAACREFLFKQEAVAAPIAKMTFAQLASNYLAHSEKNVKESSFIDRKSMLANHYKILDNRAVESIRLSDIDRWKDSIHQYSYNYKCKLLALAKTVFLYGEKFHDIRNKDFGKVAPFRDERTKHTIRFWTEAQFLRFILFVDDYNLRTFFLFVYYTGCRKGEALGLYWDKVDFDNKKVTIDNNITYKTVDGPYKETLPKTRNSERDILLPDIIVAELKIHRQRCPTGKFVFMGDRPLPAETIRRHFNRCINSAGVPCIKIHDLRHSHASLLINTGNNDLSTAYIIASRLGHRVEETLETYGHLFPSEQKKLLDRLNM